MSDLLDVYGKPVEDYNAIMEALGAPELNAYDGDQFDDFYLQLGCQDGSAGSLLAIINAVRDSAFREKGLMGDNTLDTAKIADMIEKFRCNYVSGDDEF